MNVETLLTGGGSALIVLGAIGVGRLVLGWLTERRETTRVASQQITARVTDQATNTSLLLETLTGLHSENERLRQRVEDQEKTITELNAQLIAMQYQIAELRADVDRYTRMENGDRRG